MRQLRTPVIAAASLLAIALGVVISPSSAVDTPSGEPTRPPATAMAGEAPPKPTNGANGAQSLKRALTRDYFDLDGNPVSESNDVTVDIDRHADIQANERIHVRWSGARPTAGRAINPFGPGGMNQEYPVMLLQCRGDLDTVTPQSCWTATAGERSYSSSASVAADTAVWLDDRYNTADDQKRVSGMTEEQEAAKPDGHCVYNTDTAAHVNPFVAQDGEVFYGCSSQDMPPEAGDSSGSQPNEVAAFTGADGSGSIDFEIRTEAENKSLGCSRTVTCSLVAVPIMGISCQVATQQVCNRAGQYSPGQYDQGTGSDLAVTANLWWSPSNWRNRFVFPLTLAPAPDFCSLNASGAPVPFYGSELMTQAALQWTPAYCLNSGRFNWQDNVMPDDAAFDLMSAGTAPAALVTDARPEAETVAYAPTAVSGWGIAFNIDRPDGSQLRSLKLNARLIAKLLTESYPGSATAAERPGLGNNPFSLNLDEEFQELNPGLSKRSFSEAAAALLALSIPNDLMVSVMNYLAADKDAAAFLAGRADPWGMRVNPAYQGIRLPTPSGTWPLLDTWIATAGDCLKKNPAPYLPRVAAPVSSLRLISRAMLFNWPNVTTACSYDQASDLYTIGRVPPQGIGSRFQLGLVSLGDAARFGLTLAELEAADGHYVPAGNAGMAAAIDLAKQPGVEAAEKKGKAGRKSKKKAKLTSLEPFVVDQAVVKKSATAYPGTMIVNTAAKTYGLDQTSANQVGQFIQVATTEGQVPGRSQGRLPVGYLPITGSGPTAKLLAAANAARLAILAQKAPKTPKTSPSTVADPPAVSAPTTPTGPTAPPAVVPPVSGVSVPTAATPPGTAEVAGAADTVGVSSSIGGGLLPMLLILGGLAGLASLATRTVLRLRGVR